MSHTVQVLNSLLSTLKIPIQIQSLHECVPLLFVSITEQLLHTRIPGIQRTFSDTLSKRIQDKRTNLQLLLKFLEKEIGISLEHIGIEQVLQTEEREIGFLVEILSGLCEEIMNENEEIGDISSIQGIGSVASLDEAEASHEDILPNIENVREKENEDKKDEMKEIKETQRTRKDPTMLREAEDDLSEFLERQSSNYSSKEVEIPASIPHQKDVNDIRQKTLTKPEMETETLNDSIPLSILKGKHKLLISQLDSIEKESKDEELILLDKRIKRLESYPPAPPKYQNAKPKKYRSTKQNTKPANSQLEKEHEMLKSEIYKGGKVHQIPEKCDEKFWHNQISGWKKCLKDRLWRRNVQKAKVLQSILNQKELENVVEDEQIANKKLKKFKEDKEEIRKAKNKMQERQRMVVRMKKRQQDLDEEITKMERQKRMREEEIPNEIYQDYLKKQRKEIIEKRRYIKEIESDINKELEKKKNAEIEFFRTQNEMLKEKIEETRKEQEIMRKAHEAEIRRLGVEQKQKLRRDIKESTEKLKASVSDLYEREDVEKLKNSVRMELRRRS